MEVTGPRRDTWKLQGLRGTHGGNGTQDGDMEGQDQEGQDHKEPMEGQEQAPSRAMGQEVQGTWHGAG